MKSNLYLLIILVLFSTFINAQTVEAQWEKCYGGTETDEGLGIIKVDSSYWIVGHTNSVNGDISYNHGAWDIWFVNIDEYGNIITEKTFGGSNLDGGYVDIMKLNDSVFYIVARTKSEDGDISSNPWPGPLGNYWILQINNQGDIIWEKVHGGSDEEMIRDLTITNDGGIITLGLSKSTDGDIVDHAGWYDLWMVKLNKNGTKEWTMSLGGIGLEEGGFVRQTSDGGYIVGGCTDGYGGGNYDTICNYHGIEGEWGGWVDVWIVKLDSSRNIEWQQTYGGKYHDSAKDIIETEDGYVICATTNSNDGDVTNFHGVAGNQEYGNDIWVIKIDKLGNILWENCYGGLYEENSRNIFTTSDGGYMIIGSTSSDDGDVEGYHGIDTGIYDDIWLAKIDSIGNLTWQYCYGGGGRELLYRGVVQEGDYDYTITLSTDSDEWQCKSSWQPDLRVVKLTDSVVVINEKITNNENKIMVSPNPAVARIEFSINSPELIEGKTKMRFFNSNGKLVNIKQITGNSTILTYDVSTLIPGIYYYKMSIGGVIETGKFVIVR